MLNSTLFVFVGDHGAHLYELDTEQVLSKMPKDAQVQPTFLSERSEEYLFDVSAIFHTKNKKIQHILQSIKERVRREKNLYSNYTNLDILPTVLDLLGVSSDAPSNTGDSQGNRNLQSYLTKPTSWMPSWIDGRSILRSPKPRITLSFNNPGTGIILREWPLVLVKPHVDKDLYQAFNLTSDYYQTNPMHVWYDTKPGEQLVPLHNWGLHAIKLMEAALGDLRSAYQTGKACNHTCALSQLQVLQSVYDWN